MRLLFLSLMTALLVSEVDAAEPEQRVLYITINQAGRITVGGGDTIDVSDVAKQVKDALFKSSLGNRKYYKISISQLGGNISLSALKGLSEKVSEGQLMALNAICLEKFKRLYSDLDQKKQEKLKKQYPVLFLTDYS